MGGNFKETLSFKDYCQLKQNEKGRYSGGTKYTKLRVVVYHWEDVLPQI